MNSFIGPNKNYSGIESYEDIWEDVYKIFIFAFSFTLRQNLNALISTGLKECVRLILVTPILSKSCKLLLWKNSVTNDGDC